MKAGGFFYALGRERGVRSFSKLPMLRNYCLSFCLLLALVVLTGCQSESPSNVAPFYPSLDSSFRVDAAQEAEIFTRLQNLQTEPLRQAFAALHDDTFTAAVHLTQREANGALVANQQQRLFVLGADSVQVVSENAPGTFSFGVFSAFADEADPSVPRLDADQVLPDDPPYLAPRTREAYRYHQLADTLINGSQHHVYEVVARPETGDNQPIRRARFFVEPSENVLTGFYMQRREQALLYQEASQHFVRITPHGTGWAADSLRLQARIKTPFRPAERYEVAVSYTATL